MLGYLVKNLSHQTTKFHRRFESVVQIVSHCVEVPFAQQSKVRLLKEVVDELIPRIDDLGQVLLKFFDIESARVRKKTHQGPKSRDPRLSLELPQRIKTVRASLRMNERHDDFKPELNLLVHQQIATHSLHYVIRHNRRS